MGLITAIRVIVAGAAGIAVFALFEKVLHVQTWISAVISIVAVAVGIATSVADFAKKVIEPIKLLSDTKKTQLETEKLQRDADKENRLIQPATPDEIRQYSSLRERKIRYVCLEEQKESLKANPFVVDDREDKR